MYNQSIIANYIIAKWFNITGCILSILIAMFCKETGITAIVSIRIILYLHLFLFLFFFAIIIIYITGNLCCV